MDKYFFISELVKSTIWPFTLFIISLIFRKQIKDLFVNIHSIKAKEYEILFSKQINDKIPGIKEKVKQTRLTKELQVIINNKPELAIFEAWRILERKAYEKASELKITEKRNGYSFLRDIEYQRLINTASIIPELRNIRNLIAHGGAKNITKKFAREYIGYCEEIIKEIEKIKFLPKMKLSSLTYIIMNLNMLIDADVHKSITLEIIKTHIASNDVLQYLKSIFPDILDFSIQTSTDYKDFLEKYYQELNEILGGYDGAERRKWGVEKNGICLLIAWTSEIIQRGSNWKEPGSAK